MTVGLTLGKFAPFHHGHQLVIEQALANTDQVIVVIYDAPETTPVPLPRRADWIRQRYPSVELVEAWDGPTTVGDTPEIMKQQEDYLLELLGDRRITHFFSSEFYGDHISKALAAQDCRVDPARSQVPISGTVLRQNPYEHRHFLDPQVYQSLITKVVFLGAPSTGKTSLARALAEQFNTVWMPEYGREYWEQHQQERRLSLEQLVEIAEGHLQREDAFTLEADQFLFVDTDATTTQMFSQAYHGTAHPQLATLANQTLGRYDLFFLCDDDIPYDDTWDRSGASHRTTFQKQIRADLLHRNIPFITLKGDLKTRIATVSALLQRFDKFDAIGDNLLRASLGG